MEEDEEEDEDKDEEEEEEEEGQRRRDMEAKLLPARFNVLRKKCLWTD